MLMIINEFNGFCAGFLPDVRLEKRTEKVMNDMLTFGKVVVNKFCKSNTDKIGAYRMLSNSSFDHKDISQALFQACKRNQGVKHLLCLQDTTEFNFTNHFKGIGSDDNDIGPITNEKNAGFFCHPMLVIDAENYLPLGISYAKLWNRQWDKINRHEREYKSQKITDKESFRWIESAQKTKDLLTETQMKTIIGDRESDIYEELAIVSDKNTKLLIRSSINRRLYDSDNNLYETLEVLDQRAIYEIEIKGNKKRKNRTAKIALRYTPVKLQKPNKKHMSSYPDYVDVWAIEARELDQTVPEGEDPVLWRLLTTHNIESVNDALNCTKWYSYRWLIEEFFRVLKSQGLEIEASQLESGAALKKLVILSLQVALTTMLLRMSLECKREIKAETVFTNQQIQFIILMMNQLEGNTKKQQNPYIKSTLAWGTWAIARLSGWSGYKSHGPPGYISIKRGLDIFYNKYEGYLVAMNLLSQKDVYKE